MPRRTSALLAWIPIVALACDSPSHTIPGSAAADDTGDTDEPDPPEATIYDLQGGLVEEGSEVRLVEVVVTSPVDLRLFGVYVEEPEGGERSGIYLSLAEDIAADVALAPGVVVTLNGVYSEVRGRSQVAVTALDDLELAEPEGAPIAIPEPALLAPADIATGGPLADAYEGVLVRVEGVDVTDPDLGFGEFEVSGGLRVDDYFFPIDGAPTPTAGQHLDAIVGPLLYTYDDTKIGPRSFADLQGWSGRSAGPRPLAAAHEGPEAR